MQRLPPLAIGFLVAVGTVFGIRKGARLDEVIALHLHRAWNERLVLAEAKVISLTYLAGVLLALGLLGRTIGILLAAAALQLGRTLWRRLLVAILAESGSGGDRQDK